MSLSRLIPAKALLRPRAISVRQKGIVTSSFLRSGNINRIPIAASTRRDEHDSERVVMPIDGSKSSHISLSIHDNGRRAVAFDKSLVERMTPTMRSFTLESKVAVVTG